MNVRTRNRIVRASQMTVSLLLVSVVIFLAFKVSVKDGVSAMVVFVLGLAGSYYGRMRYVRAIESARDQMLKATGLKREDLRRAEEAPIPILPSPFLPKNKKEWARALIVITMLVALLILGLTGMLKKWFLE